MKKCKDRKLIGELSERSELSSIVPDTLFDTMSPPGAADDALAAFVAGQAAVGDAVDRAGLGAAEIDRAPYRARLEPEIAVDDRVSAAAAATRSAQACDGSV